MAHYSGVHVVFEYEIETPSGEVSCASQLGFSETVGGDLTAIMAEAAHTLGFADLIDVEVLTEIEPTIVNQVLGLADTINGELTAIMAEAAHTLGFADLIDVEVLITIEPTIVNQVLGLADTTEGHATLRSKGYADIIGFNDGMVGHSFTQHLIPQLGFSDNIGNNIEANEEVTSYVGFADAIHGERPGAPSLPEGLIGFGDLVGHTTEYLRNSFSNVGFSISIEAENVGSLIPHFPVNLTYKFYLILTGANNGLDDYEIEKLHTIQFRMKSGGESSYLGVSALYTSNAEAQILSRTSGTLILSMASYYQGVEVLRENLMEVNFSSARFDIGTKSQSITIDSYGVLTYTHDTTYLIDAIQKRVNQDGRVNYRFARPDFYLRPGHKGVYGVESFTVDEVAYYVGENEFYMDVYFEPTTLSGFNQTELYRTHALPVEKGRKFFVTITGSQNGLDDYAIPDIISIEARLKAGARSYVSISIIYSEASRQALIARPNGRIVITAVDGVGALPEQWIFVNFNEMSYNWVSDSRVINIVGYRVIRFPHLALYFTVKKAISERVLSDGSFDLGLVDFGLNIRPGYNLYYHGRDYYVGETHFIFTHNTATLRIISTINVSLENPVANTLGLGAALVSNSFYRPENDFTFGLNNDAHVSLNGVQNAYHDTCNFGFTAYVGYDLNP